MLEQAAKEFAEGVEAIEGLELAGQPVMTVVAFKAVKPRALNIYAVNDALSARGWHLNALQLPPALHMCFTAQHATIVKPLLKARMPLHRLQFLRVHESRDQTVAGRLSARKRTGCVSISKEFCRGTI